MIDLFKCVKILTWKVQMVEHLWFCKVSMVDHKLFNYLYLGKLAITIKKNFGKPKLLIELLPRCDLKRLISFKYRSKWLHHNCFTVVLKCVIMLTISFWKSYVFQRSHVEPQHSFKVMKLHMAAALIIWYWQDQLCVQVHINNTMAH